MSTRRGREGLLSCEKCGRQVRRDKAVFIEKLVFANPLERKDVIDENYSRGTYREVGYCPSCGKHMRIYEKKKQQNDRARDREMAFGGRPFRRPAFTHPYASPRPQPPSQGQGNTPQGGSSA